LKIDPKLIETVTPVITMHTFGMLVKHLKKGSGGILKMICLRLVVHYSNVQLMSLREILSLKITNHNWPFHCQGH
jgi:hypothetical protein